MYVLGLIRCYFQKYTDIVISPKFVITATAAVRVDVGAEGGFAWKFQCKQH